MDNAQHLLELALGLAEEGADQDAIARLVDAANSPGDLLEASRRVSLRMNGNGRVAFSYLTGAVRQMLGS